MKTAALLFLLSMGILSAEESSDWFKKIVKQKVAEANSQYDYSEIQARNNEILKENYKKPCYIPPVSQDDPSLLVFMSFSVPDRLWVELSESLQKVGGAFVIRGLPDNSFRSFANKVASLRKRGVHAPIVLNPPDFSKYQINLVPTTILIDDNRFDKMTGTTSIRYALETFEKQGDTKNAKSLLDKLNRGA